MFSCTDTTSYTFEEFTIDVHDEVASEQTYINITGAGAGWGHKIWRVNFLNGAIGVAISASNIYQIEDCGFTSFTVTGAAISNSAAPDAGDSAITGCVFNATSNPSAPVVGILQTSSGGLRVSNNTFLNCDFHYLGEFNTGTSSTSILLIENNSMEHAAAATSP